MVDRESISRDELWGLIAGGVFFFLLVFTLIAIATIYFG